VSSGENMSQSICNEHQKSHSDNRIIFSIDDDDMAFIFSILRNNMYSNSIKIVVQEYLCNGRDAHREAKKVSKPLDVNLPSNENPNFIVRDYGNSLTYEKMINVFCKYGKSTKRGTNQTGGFGIGAKSAWAYGSNFFIETYINGEKTNYRFFVDDSSQKGEMEVLSVNKTDEENGLKVTVPVVQSDFNNFHEWYKHVTHYWGIKPNTNTNISYTDYEKDIIFENDFILYTNCFYNKATIMVDDIPYPIDIQALTKLNVIDSKYLDFLNTPFYLFCKPSDVDVSATREQLNYTNKTTNYLIEKIIHGYETVENYIQSLVNSCKDYISAIRLWETNGEKYEIYRKYFSHIKWNDMQLEGILNKLNRIPCATFSRNKHNNGVGIDICHIFLENGQLKLYNQSKLSLDIKTYNTAKFFIVTNSKKIVKDKIIKAALMILGDMGIDKVEYNNFYVLTLPTATEDYAEISSHFKSINFDKMNTYILENMNLNKVVINPNCIKKKVEKEDLVKVKIFGRFSNISSATFKSIGDIKGLYCYGHYNSIFDPFEPSRLITPSTFITKYYTLFDYFKIDNVFIISKKYESKVIDNKLLFNVLELKDSNKNVYDEDKCIEIHENLNNTKFIINIRHNVSNLFNQLNKHLDKLSNEKVVNILKYFSSDTIVCKEYLLYLTAMTQLKFFDSSKCDIESTDTVTQFKNMYDEFMLKYPLTEIFQHLFRSDIKLIKPRHMDDIIKYYNS
jgi:hypothetical protein